MMASSDEQQQQQATSPLPPIVQQQALAPPPYQQMQQQVTAASLNNIIGGVPQSPISLGASSPSAPTVLNRKSKSARKQANNDRKAETTEIMEFTPPVPTKMRPENALHTVAAMVVDRSGSMSSMGAEVHGGCNAYLEECRKADEEDNSDTSVIFVRFDNTVECVHDSVSLKNLPPISAADVAPRGSTALYDAIGCTIQKTTEALEKLDHVPKVVIFILTDGKENASQIWNKKSINKEITKLQAAPYNWDFYFAAANQDAMEEGHRMGVDVNTCITYVSTPKGMSSAFECQAKAYNRKKKGGCKGYTAAERSLCSEE